MIAYIRAALAIETMRRAWLAVRWAENNRPFPGGPVIRMIETSTGKVFRFEIPRKLRHLVKLKGKAVRRAGR
jgi:hypothetical protein